MQHQVDDVHLGINLLLHIVILILHLSDDGTFTVSLIHLFCTSLDETFAVFKALTVMVADDIVQFGLFNVTLDTQQMVESLIAFCRLRTLVGRQQLGKLRSQHIGVHHLVFCIAWVYAYAFDEDLGAGSVEVLELQFPQVATIHGISPVAAELLHVEMMGTHTNLLVRVEGDADLAVLHFRMVFQPAHRLNDLCDTGLVVGT